MFLRYSILNTAVLANTTVEEGNLFETDPEFGPLQDNGGPTPTRLPLEGSPAIDAGDPALDLGAAPEFDQRGDGVPRVRNGRVDIGAVETVPVLSSTGSEFPWAAAVLGALALGIGVITLVQMRRHSIT